MTDELDRYTERLNQRRPRSTDEGVSIEDKLNGPTPKIDTLLLTSGTLAALMAVLESLQDVMAGKNDAAASNIDDALSTVTELQGFLVQLQKNGEIYRGDR